MMSGRTSLGHSGAGGLAALLLALPTMARAGPQADPAKPVSEVVATAIKSVSELVVTAPVKCPRTSGVLNLDLPAKPVVVSTYPAQGQKVRPGLVVVRVTFDRPVACAGGFSNDPPLVNPCPDRVQHMVLSFDRRTVRTVCLLDRDKAYGLRLNKEPGNGFRTVDGAVGEEFDLRFSTTLEDPTTDVCEAVRQDTAMLVEVEKAHPLNCAPRDDPQSAMVKAEVERRDMAARAERERAIAEAQALREKQAADELARAEKLAQAAYRKARDRNWAKIRTVAARAPRDVEDDRLVAGFELGKAKEPSRFDQALVDDAVLPRRPTVPDAPRLAQPTRPPELPYWRQTFVVGATAYDCAFEHTAVVCRRR